MSNLSNIELYHNNLTLSKIEDKAILEHANVLYKNYADLGWRPYHYKCKYCTKVTRNLEKFIEHLEVCPGLEDDYVPKPKRRIR